MAGAKGKAEKWLEPDNLLLLSKWARNGLTDAAIAKKMEITAPTLWRWKKKHEAIFNALARTKEIVDTEVENKLHESCLGYTVTVREPVKIRTVKIKTGEGRIEEEHIEYAEREIYIPPNVIAQKFWLANRIPTDWREKREAPEETPSIVKENVMSIGDAIHRVLPDRKIEDIDRLAAGEAEGSGEGA